MLNPQSKLKKKKKKKKVENVINLTKNQNYQYKNK